MKFWRSRKNSSSPSESSAKCKNGCKIQAASSKPDSYSDSNAALMSPGSLRRRRSNTISLKSGSRGCSPSVSSSIYDECSPLEIGTTFVELIKRHGTHLGVMVSGGVPESGSEPRIVDLIQGSWAQRSDVLCIGDVIVSINGKEAANLPQKTLDQLLEQSDRIQLEVEYKLPMAPSLRQGAPAKASRVIQVTLKKDNGSFGMVIRGGAHEVIRKSRPFTVIHITPHGPTFLDGTIRIGDRILALNGIDLRNMKLAELQGLLYNQDHSTVFTVEYDVALHPHLPPEVGSILVEIRREVGDILGFGLNRCEESGHIYIESIKQASLADRCGAMHVGDILISVNGNHVARLEVDTVLDLIRGDPTITTMVCLEIMPGAYSRGCRSSMPSPCYSPQPTFSPRPLICPSSARPYRKCTRYRSLSEIDRPLMLPSPSRERRKFVSFTVEIQRDGGPLGLTLATEGDADVPGPIFISSLLENGLAQRTKTIQKNDQLVEVNGQSVQGKCLNDVIHLVQNAGDNIKLKLARLISIPERDITTLLLRNRPDVKDPHGVMMGQSVTRKPPLPSPSPCRSSSLTKSPTPSETSTSKAANSGSTCVSLVPALRSGGRPVPMEVFKITLFKDHVYEDFGFSVSDGLYEKGIFVNRIRKGGPADCSGLLKPLDRILQINETRTDDFDCCLAVPLIASSGDRIEVLATRPSQRLSACSNGSQDMALTCSSQASDDSFDNGTLRAPSSRSPQCSSTTTSVLAWMDDENSSALSTLRPIHPS